MEFVILDLEWNGAYSRKNKKNINEIIEFGAIKCDGHFNVTDTFTSLVTPQISRHIQPAVKELTSISIKSLRESGKRYTHVLKNFKKFLGDAVLCTWSTSDILALIENEKYYEHRLPGYISKYLNIQAYAQNVLGLSDSQQLGLLPAAQMLAVECREQDMHRALSDCEITLLCLKKIYDAQKVQHYIEDATLPEFYRKLTFKSYYINDIRNPNIDKKQFFINCMACGMRAARKSGWNAKNNFFFAEFYCSRCKEKFMGKIFFKQKYDRVTVSRKTAPIPAVENMQGEAFGTRPEDSSFS